MLEVRSLDTTSTPIVDAQALAMSVPCVHILRLVRQRPATAAAAATSPDVPALLAAR
jgi:hypothetical protein